MTAILYFIRHAAHGHLGHILSGRTPGLPLSELGRGQADRLGRALADRPFAAIYCSPVQRAQETADAIARTRTVPIETSPALDEVDFGAWTGQPFAALAGDEQWSRWNAERDIARAPGGETMAEAQARMIGFAADAARLHDERAVALVSHGDMIRAALAHYLGLSLRHLLRFEIDAASVSRVAIGDRGARVLSVNEALA